MWNSTSWMRGAALVASMAMVSPAAAAACSVCLCGDNHAANLGLDTPVVGQWRIGAEQRFSSKSNALEGGAAGTESSHDSRSTLMLSYSPSTRASYGVNLPLVDRRSEITGQPVTTTSLQFGDLEAQARYDVRVRQSHDVFSATRILVGVTAPTGTNNLMHVGDPNQEICVAFRDGCLTGKQDILPHSGPSGDRYDEHVQPGTGAWAGTVGLAQIWSRPGQWIYGSAVYRALGTNRHGYRYGASVLGTIEGGQRIGKGVSAVFGVAARTTQMDRTGIAEEPMLDESGGKVAFVTPGMQAKIGNSWIAKAQVFVPAWSDLHGTQVEKTNVIARLTYTR